MMDFELEYLRRYDALCKAEGRKGGLPVTPKFGTARRVDYEPVIRSMRKGLTRATDIAKDMGKSRRTINDWINQLVKDGRVVKVGTQWRVKE